MPGFGHGTHKPDDPRAVRLFQIAHEAGKAGRYVTLLETLGREVDTAFGRHITINATGAIAALLLEIGVPVAAMRAYSVVSRAGGLVGHLLEEQASHSGRAIWAAAKAAVPVRRSTDFTVSGPGQLRGRGAFYDTPHAIHTSRIRRIALVVVRIAGLFGGAGSIQPLLSVIAGVTVDLGAPPLRSMHSACRRPGIPASTRAWRSTKGSRMSTATA